MCLQSINFVIKLLIKETFGDICNFDTNTFRDDIDTTSRTKMTICSTVMSSVAKDLIMFLYVMNENDP